MSKQAEALRLAAIEEQHGEFLKALKLVVAYDEGDHIDGLEMMLAYSKALDAVRAAIAKAEREKA
jgi:hypothetical protein